MYIAIDFLLLRLYLTIFRSPVGLIKLGIIILKNVSMKIQIGSISEIELISLGGSKGGLTDNLI